MGIVPYGGLEIMFAETAQAAVGESENEFVQQHRQSARAAVGCVSTATAASLVYPIALLRTRMQAQASLSDAPASAFDVASRAWSQGGLPALYRVRCCLNSCIFLHFAPAPCSCLPCAECATACVLAFPRPGCFMYVLQSSCVHDDGDSPRLKPPS